MASASENVPELLASMASGDESAAERLFPIVYEQLHKLASNYMRHERSDHTLQPTALIHEAFLKLVRPADKGVGDGPRFQDEKHFIATAAVVMRRVLVNHAKAKQAKKRDGKRAAIEIDEVAATFSDRSIDLLALDESLQRLKQLDAVQHKIVELRFFGGMTVEQCADFMELSERAAYYEWAHARAWLRKELGSCE